MLVHQAYRFELDPSNHGQAGLASHAGAARFAYNWGLALVLERLAARRAMVVLATRQGAGLVEADAWARDMVSVPWTLYALRREWNAAKAEVAPWWAENSKEAYSSGLDRLARALGAFSDSRSGKRKGARVGFPRFHRRDGRRSFRYTTGAFGVVDARHVRLPRIGVVRTKEPTTALARGVETGTARVLSATVSERAERWYVSFGVETERAVPVAQPDAVVGVDVGVKVLAVLSTGETVPNPKHLGRYQRRMRRLQGELSRRRGPAKGRRPSKRWKASRKRLARVHANVANARSDGLHKLTTRLARSYGTVVVEDLNVKGMTASAKGSGHWRGKAGLNRSLLDASPAELRRRLTYRTTWYGSTLVVADRWYPSSKTCSACQTAKAKLPLAERTFRCRHCGLVIDRDLNAAANLASLVEAATGTASGAGTGQGTALANAQGEEKFMGSPRCSSTNCEDGASPTGPGKTATAAEQSTAA